LQSQSGLVQRNRRHRGKRMRPFAPSPFRFETETRLSKVRKAPLFNDPAFTEKAMQA
jgi:hypothetical protein